MTNCLNLQNPDVQQWVNQEGILATYSIYLQNGYLPDYAEWKSMNVDISLTDARDILSSILPINMLQIKPLSDIVDTLPLNTVGAYLNSIIYLNERPTKAEVYEEGFHFIFDKLVSTEEKKDLLKAMQAILANRLKKEGTTINKYLDSIISKYPESYKNQTREQQLNRLFEEELASMFVDSKQFKNPYSLESSLKETLKPILGSTLAIKISSLITKVFNYLKNIFKIYKSNEETIKLFFKSIESGKYKNGQVVAGENSSTIPFTKILELKFTEYDDIFEEDITHIKRYTPEQTQSTIRNIGAIYFQLENERIDNKKEDRLNRAVQLYFELSKDLKEFEEIDINSEINTESINSLKQDVQDYIDEFKSIVDFDEDTIESEEGTSNSFANFESSADEKSPLESSYSKALKLRIGKTGKVKYIKPIQVDVNGTPKEVYIKLIESVDVAKTYYSIARALSNTLKDEDRWEKLIAFSNFSNNVDTKAFVDQLLFDLFSNHPLVKNVGKDADNEFYLKLDKIKQLYNSREEGFVIFPQKGEESKIISSNNAVIVNSIVKGFDLYKRNNITITYDVTNKKAKVFNANDNNIRKIQTNTWKNNLIELKESGKDISDVLKMDNIKFQVTSIEDLLKSVETLNYYFNTLGIPISSQYIKYSLGKLNQELLSNIQEPSAEVLELLQLLSIFKVPDNNLLSKESLAVIHTKIKDYFSTESASIDQTIFDNIKGVVGRLDNIAEGNGYFDERIPDSTYKTAEGKTKYNFQLKTWHLQKVTAMLENPKDINTYRVLVSEGEMLKEGDELIQSNYLFDKFNNDSEYSKLLESGDISHFSAADIRLSESPEIKDGKIVKEGRSEDGVSIGGMSNRDFMIYLFNLFAGRANSKGLSPVYFGNYEASKTFEFIYLPFIKDLVDNNGNITEKTIDLLSKEIEKEYNRVQRTSQIAKFDTTYTKYNTGKRKAFKYKDVIFYIPYSEKNGVKTVNFANFRAGMFSDYVSNISDNLDLGSEFEAILNSHLSNNADVIELSEEDVSKASILGYAYLGLPFESIKNKLNIANSINTMNDSLVDMLESQGVIKDNSSILLDRFYENPEKLSSIYGFTKGALKVNLKKKITSDFLNTMFLNQLLQGDQALLYKNDLVDIFKRFKGRNAAIVSSVTSTIAPSLGITKPWKTLKYVVHEEIESRSGIDTGNINQADAQNYTTVEYMRYMLYSQGRLPADLADILNKIEQGEPVDDSKIFNQELYTPILKTVFFDGRVYLKKSDFMLTKANNSRFVKVTKEEAELYGEIDSLTGQWKPKDGATREIVKWSNGTYYEVFPNQNKELHERRKVMEGWRYDDKTDSWKYTGNKIELSMPLSASKMLNRNTLKGHDLKNIKDENINTLDLQYYGLQVETPHPHDDIPDPTQYLEIALNELDRTKTNKFIIDGIEYSASELEDLYQDAMTQRRAISIDSLIDEIIDKDTQQAKLDAFRERFSKSLESSGAEKQMLDLVQGGYNLNIPIIKDKYFSQIFSHFTKGGLSQRRRGDAAAHVSSHGQKLIKQAVKEEVNGNIVWSWKVIPSYSNTYKDINPDDLPDLSSKDFYPDVNGKPSKNREKHLINGEDNSLQTALSKLGEGAYFIDELRHLKPRIENNKITGYFTEMILSKYNINQSEISDEERYMFAVRIPSQDKHSGVNLEWVDFFPAYHGSAVSVAKEIVQLSGSDFDIDKLYISKPEGYYTKEGFRKYQNTFEDFIRYQFDNNKELRKLLKDKKQNSELYKNLKEEIANIFKTKKELYETITEQREKLKISNVKAEKITSILNFQTKLDFIYSKMLAGEATSEEVIHTVTLRRAIEADINTLGKLKITPEVESFVANLNKFYELTSQASKTLLDEKLKELEIVLNSFQIESLKELNIPYTQELYEAYTSKYNGYGNRGYINNILLQANQQALANEQTLDNGGISDTPASMGYMGNGVLKEFPLFLSDVQYESVKNKTYEGDIKELKDNQVFVFGANSLGLHGRGSAGVAMGEQRSLSQIKNLPDGSKGNWAVKGATGFMEGLKGNSYGLITVLGEPQGRNNPNKISIEQLKNNIKDFYDFAKANPKKEFLLAYSGKNPDVLNLNGYTSRQLASFFSSFEIPENIVFEKEFYNLLDKKPLQSNSGNKEYLLSKDGKTFVNANKVKYNVHHLLGQIITDKNNRTGKANIGIDVNWNLLNIVLNRIGAGINPSNAITIEINGVTKTFGSLQLFLQEPVDGSNLRVFDVISTLISSATDEAKEQLNARYGLNIDALNAVLPFVAMGGNLSIALALVNQPLIKQFLEFKSKKNYAITTEAEAELKTLSTIGIVEKVLANNKLDLSLLDTSLDVIYSIEDLAKGLRGIVLDKDIQVKMLLDFLSLSQITEWGGNLVAAIKLKKGLPSDLYSFENELRKINALGLDNPNEDSTLRPIDIKTALEKNKNTKAKEIVSAIGIVNNINSILPKLLANKTYYFVKLKEAVLALAKPKLSTDTIKELDNELESFIYGYYYNELLKEAGVEDALIAKYLKTFLIDANADNNIKNIFLKFKEKAAENERLRNNPLIKKLELTESNGIVSLKLNQLVKLSDTQMTELSDSFTYLANLVEPLEDSISPREFTKMLQALFIVKDGFQFKYEGVSKIFPVEIFSRLSSIIDSLQNNTNKEIDDNVIKLFLDRYFLSIRHKQVIPFISPSKINTPEFQLIGDDTQYKIAYIKVVNDEGTAKALIENKSYNINKDGRVLEYLRIGNNYRVHLMKKVGIKDGYIVYEEVEYEGATNITTMSLSIDEQPFKPKVVARERLSLDTVSPAVKNTEIDSIKDIYNQLGNKTQSENVSIKPWSELKDATKAVTSVGIVSTRIKGSEAHFGNIYLSIYSDTINYLIEGYKKDGLYIQKIKRAGSEEILRTSLVQNRKLIPTKSTKESVEKYIEWIITGEIGIDLYDNTTPDVYELEERREWLLKQIKSGDLKNKDILYYKELGEPSHATALDWLINSPNSPFNQSVNVEQTIPNSMSEITNHSGGAKGYDTYWDNTGKSYGFLNHNHYTVDYYSSLSSSEKTIYNDMYLKAIKWLGRGALNENSYAGKLVRRDMVQATKADGIFAISEIVAPNFKGRKGYINKTNHPIVEGGTGYAVASAILQNKPVYVFNQDSSYGYEIGWYFWNSNDFVKTDVPFLTKNFAGIGSSTNETEIGKQAIKDVYEKTINFLNTSKPVEQSTKIGTNNAPKNTAEGKKTNSNLTGFNSYELLKPFYENEKDEDLIELKNKLNEDNYIDLNGIKYSTLKKIKGEYIEKAFTFPKRHAYTKFNTTTFEDYFMDNSTKIYKEIELYLKNYKVLTLEDYLTSNTFYYLNEEWIPEIITKSDEYEEGNVDFIIKNLDTILREGRLLDSKGLGEWLSPSEDDLEIPENSNQPVENNDESLKNSTTDVNEEITKMYIDNNTIYKFKMLGNQIISGESSSDNINYVTLSNPKEVYNSIDKSKIFTDTGEEFIIEDEQIDNIPNQTYTDAQIINFLKSLPVLQFTKKFGNFSSYSFDTLLANSVSNQELFINKPKHYILEVNYITSESIYRKNTIRVGKYLVDTVNETITPIIIVWENNMTYHESIFISPNNEIKTLKPSDIGSLKIKEESGHFVKNNLNINANVGSQNNKPFVEKPVSQKLTLGRGSKLIVIPEGASSTNDVIFENSTHIYLMNNQQQQAFNAIKKAIDNYDRPVFTQNAVVFENEYLNNVYKNTVNLSLFNSMLGIQGSGGTGKTTLAQAIVRYYKSKFPGNSVIFSAPTHRAATVLQESLGKDSEYVDNGNVYTNASLIGSLKEDGETFTLSPAKNYFKRRKPKIGEDVDFIIFDESSMVDINFIKALEQRIKESSTKKVPLMLFLGDMKQLPPISNSTYNRGFIAMAILANPQKSSKLTQIMRSSDEFFVSIYDSIGKQIEQNIYNKLNGLPLNKYDYTEFYKLIQKSEGNLDVHTSEDSIVAKYAEVLFNNLSPKRAYYSHYNRIDNAVTVNLLNKIRKEYLSKIYGTTSHLNFKIPFGKVNDYLDMYGAKNTLNQEGLSSVEDLTKVLQFVELDGIRSFIYGDYVQAPDNLEISSSNYIVSEDTLNPFALQVLKDLQDSKPNVGFYFRTDGNIMFEGTGAFKPSSRYKVLDIHQNRTSVDLLFNKAKITKGVSQEILNTPISKDSKDLGIYINKNSELIEEHVLLFTRQEKVRVYSYLMNTFSTWETVNDGLDINRRPINLRVVYSLHIANTKELLFRVVVPYWDSLSSDFKEFIFLMGRNITNFEQQGQVYAQNHFSKSYLGSSHTTQGDSFIEIFAGVNNVLGQTKADPESVASSLYTILTRSMKNISVLNSKTINPESDGKDNFELCDYE